jgi:hypothetical protein
MDTGRSWLIGDARPASVVLALSAGLLITAAGAGLLGNQDWWSLIGIIGGALSLALFVLFFSPWFLGAIVVTSAALLAAVRLGVSA